MRVLEQQSKQYGQDAVNGGADLPEDADEFAGSLALAYREGWRAALKMLLAADDLDDMPAIIEQIDAAI